MTEYGDDHFVLVARFAGKAETKHIIGAIEYNGEWNPPTYKALCGKRVSGWGWFFGKTDCPECRRRLAEKRRAQ